MHVNIGQLIAVRDGEPVDADIRDHVERCVACQGSVAELRAMRKALAELPTEIPPEGAWNRIIENRRMESAPSVHPRHPAIAAGLAAVSIAVLAVLGLRSLPVVERENPPREQAQLAHLQQQSRELEQLLRQYRAPAVVSVRAASTVGELEDSIALIDYRLSSPGVSGAEQRSLWAQRVALMESLVTVRTVEHIAGGI